MYTSAKIDIAFLLNYLSEEVLMEEYLGIQVQFSKLVSNPLRRDNNPTCGFYYYNNRLNFKDFAGKKYDFLNVVMEKYRLGYNDACRKVYHDFLGREHKVLHRPVIQIQRVNKETELRIKSREWNKQDDEYWSKFGITREILTKYKVKPISHYWLNEYVFEVTERVYAYCFGNHKYKLYFVDRPKGSVRFLQNCSDLVLGTDQLPEQSDVIILTKSYKDVMTWDSMNISSVCGLNENQVIKAKEIKLLKSRCKKLYFLSDWDRTGIHIANVHKKLYGIEPLFFKPITHSSYYKRKIWENLPNTAKDTSDTRALENGKQILNQLINFVQSHESYLSELEEKDVPFW